jgi:hypothetical protein
MSGKAVELIQGRLDMQVFIYMSNMAKAVKRSGEIWLSMAKDVLVEEGRTMKTISTQGTSGSVELMKPVMGEDGAELENDLAKAKFDVAVDVGPSSSSKRAATVRALTGMMSISTDPETLQVLGAMTMMNMEGEGIDDVKGFFRKKLVRMGVVTPNEKEIQEMQAEQANAKPDPNTVYLQAAAQEAEAKAVKARADTISTLADADKTKAETVKIAQEIDVSRQDQALALIDKFERGMQQPQPADVTVVATDAQPPAL